MQLKRSVEEKESFVISQALVVSANVAGAHGRTGRHGDMICRYHVEAPGDRRCLVEEILSHYLILWC